MNDQSKTPGAMVTLSDEDICQMASEAFGQTVDHDLRGNPITDYSVLLMGAYGPAIRRLVHLARQYPAKQAPALGGEPVVYKHRLFIPTHAQTPSTTVYRSEWVDVVLLKDHQAHIAPLQAEIEHWTIKYRQLQIKHSSERDQLKAEVERLNSEVSYLTGTLKQIASDNVDLQSELTKARELLEDCLGPVTDAENNADDAANERLYHNLGNAIRAALAHQSAPAAKEV